MIQYAIDHPWISYGVCTLVFAIWGYARSRPTELRARAKELEQSANEMEQIVDDIRAIEPGLVGPIFFAASLLWPVILIRMFYRRLYRTLWGPEVSS